MALPTFNTKSPTIKRILKEASELSSNPDPTLHAAPLDSNLFEWHFTLRGPPSTPYCTGAYHGRIILPPTYPLRPPSFRFLTPSGRFEVNREICLSISGHHEETWQPAWGIRTALWALRAFMEGDARGQVGGMEMGKVERERTNEDILKEEGGEAKEREGKQEVPEELKFGFRDEMAKAEGGEAAKENEKQSQSTSTSVPVETTPVTASTAGTSTAATVPPASSSSTALQPTHMISVPPTAQPQMRMAPPIHQAQSGGVPAWIDKVIAALVAALAFMVMRKILL
ncbi:hypothetical protein OEA41_001397 [Lepraria neglecta]|uniref:UBC core domain-containing protein n=1 Tax=Lepraria neglecta TaxID=209136 RepID=A0AAE0DP02_9LECA|nr:hypothetical protein OEA41_001397 [Lepraria neglecta]